MSNQSPMDRVPLLATEHHASFCAGIGSRRQEITNVILFSFVGISMTRNRPFFGFTPSINQPLLFDLFIELAKHSTI